MGIITPDEVSSADPRPTPRDMDQLAADAVRVLHDAIRGYESDNITADQIAAAGHALNAWAHHDANERADYRAKQETWKAEAAEEARKSPLRRVREERRRKRAPKLPQFNRLS